MSCSPPPKKIQELISGFPVNCRSASKEQQHLSNPISGTLLFTNFHWIPLSMPQGYEDYDVIKGGKREKRRRRRLFVEYGPHLFSLGLFLPALAKGRSAFPVPMEEFK